MTNKKHPQQTQAKSANQDQVYGVSDLATLEYLQKERQQATQKIERRRKLLQALTFLLSIVRFFLIGMTETQS